MNKAKANTRKVNALLASFIPELSAGPRWTSLHAQAQAKELAGLLKQTGFKASKASSELLSHRHLLVALRWAARTAYQGNASPNRKEKTAHDMKAALELLDGLNLKGAFLNAASLWAVLQLYSELPAYERFWLNQYVSELKAIAEKRTASAAVMTAHEDALRTCRHQGLFKGSNKAVPAMYLAYLDGYFQFVRQEIRRVRGMGYTHSRINAARKAVMQKQIERVYPSLLKIAERTA